MTNVLMLYRTCKFVFPFTYCNNQFISLRHIVFFIICLMIVMRLGLLKFKFHIFSFCFQWYIILMMAAIIVNLLDFHLLENAQADFN